MAGVAVDVTDRKRDEGALRGEQARFAALMDALPALIVTTTPAAKSRTSARATARTQA